MSLHEDNGLGAFVMSLGACGCVSRPHLWDPLDDAWAGVTAGVAVSPLDDEPIVRLLLDDLRDLELRSLRDPGDGTGIGNVELTTLCGLLPEPVASLLLVRLEDEVVVLVMAFAEILPKTNARTAKVTTRIIIVVACLL